MEFVHEPVLLNEVLEWMDVKPDGVYADGTSQTVLNNVTVEKAASSTTTEALAHVAGTAKLELAGNTKIDGKDTGVVGVNLAASGVTFTLNGGKVTGADVVLANGTSIGLKSKLTQTLYVKPATYDCDLMSQSQSLHQRCHQTARRYPP